MTDTSDAQLPLKKRARRRLVGAVAFAGLAAFVLPMVMDEEPKVPAQDVQIRIPSLDQPAFEPGKLAASPATKAAPAASPAQPELRSPPAPLPAPIPASPPEVVKPAVAEKAAAKPVEKPVEKAAEKPVAKPEAAAEKTAARPSAKEPAKETAKEGVKDAGKDTAKANARATDKAAEKAAEKPTDDARRAAAILGDKAAPAASSAAASAHVVLIGAFANPANVKQLQSKLGEIGVKTYTEPLESPQGLKTRLRAGPFNNRDAAEKALERMKRIGVNGVVAAKQ
ncbi:SPOR domain-containing protein [Rhodocyclus tenuis]|uniref:DedD protein n=1 Tax=Rhodocyclus tenuis TaxID=1066 RepID=A0A840G6Y9_RHOTE|nr:SPOR domain-containing protein [Rhodocyclus tenuis]MBB4248123.1 DedD protein [Rhodocyclus tenuis]